MTVRTGQGGQRRTGRWQEDIRWDKTETVTVRTGWDGTETGLTLDRIEGTGWRAGTVTGRTPYDETVAGGHGMDGTGQRVQALPRVHSLLA